MTRIELTQKQEAFAVAMADPSCPNATEAYKRAGYSVDANPNTVNRTAHNLTLNPKIVARIKELRAAAADEVLIDAKAVLREWVMIAMADPGELCRARQFCCRHCYGIDGKYQWTSEDEWARAVAAALDENTRNEGRARFVPRDIPDCDGGFGYDRDLAPVKTCERCHGDGTWDTFVTATDKLSPAGRKLFAGIKQTQHGVEIKMRDQDGALRSIAKYLGMEIERHRHGGDPDNPTPIPAASLVITGDMSQQDAAKAYQMLLSGSAPSK